ncbi:MAG: LUD domain-containing protein [Lentisphaeraceae bacterium]|nr:LUD domain-containing protein [Lentisphaeraceae bacterium]
MSSSREKILDLVKENLPDAVPRPEINFVKQTFESPVQRFCELVESVGGMTKIVSGDENLQKFSKISENDKVISSLSVIPDQNIERDKIQTAHDMKDIDYCCFHVELAVAENGAFLTHCEDFDFRSVYFLAQHLIVTVKAEDIKNNMHEAYAALGKMKRGEFTVFISGPSKTADIEQCLVIGAHGARSLQVFIYQ